MTSRLRPTSRPVPTRPPHHPWPACRHNLPTLLPYIPDTIPDIMPPEDTRRQEATQRSSGPQSFRSQFHQHFTSSFYAHRSQKCKNLLNLTVFFELLGSAHVKAAHKTLVKLTPGLSLFVSYQSSI